MYSIVLVSFSGIWSVSRQLDVFLVDSEELIAKNCSLCGAPDRAWLARADRAMKSSQEEAQFWTVQRAPDRAGFARSDRAMKKSSYEDAILETCYARPTGRGSPGLTGQRRKTVVFYAAFLRPIGRDLPGLTGRCSRLRDFSYFRISIFWGYKYPFVINF